VYHLLPETEPFSEFSGGAISRWAANVLRGDDESFVLCPATDPSWEFSSGRVHALPMLQQYRRALEAGVKFPWTIRKPILRRAIGTPLKALKAGDIVWVHNRPDFAAAISSMVRSAGAKIVLHMHNSHLADHTSKKVRDMIQADHFIFVSSFLQAEALSKFAEMNRTSVIHNGADDRLFYPSAQNGSKPHPVPRILFASRLVPDKGAHIFLDAMRELERRGTAAEGVIVGASQFGGSKQTKYIVELQQTAPSNVSFHKYCAGKELADLFRSADIFCLPSIWQDPFPLAPLEAMACKLPVVATRSGGIPEAFAEGGGILVARGSTEELVNALSELVQQPALRRQLGEEGSLSFRRNFTWQAVRRNYQAVVEDLR
jgi:glycosyltransferase involved in cell wall biosynthesis